jgi:acetyl-CoA carboxylase carboxyl transferase subunit alpha
MALATFDFEKPILDLEQELNRLKEAGASAPAGSSGEGESPEALEQRARQIAELEARLEATRHDVYSGMTPWQRVQFARHLGRPHTLDYLRRVFTDFTEFHGDRAFGDDHACVAGFAFLNGESVAVVGQQKGADVRENVYRNYGSMHPEGYRKAMRIMRLAEKFGRPIVTFIDTPGAFPGIGAEERGQAEAIARNIRDMFDLRVPIISVVIGEGGSGGALGIGVVDRFLMQENAYYSLISPEGCASILWRDAKFAPQAAECLKLTSSDLKQLGIVDEIVPEPLGGAHRDHAAAAAMIKTALEQNLATLREIEIDTLLQQRFEKFRKIGVVLGE